MLQRSFDVARVPENDGIDDKTQRPKLVLLSFTVALAQFTALAVEDGTGKTMTIGKLAWHLQEELGKTVVLGAADTFRAAAVEQLEEWARRAGVDLVKGAEGADPDPDSVQELARREIRRVYRGVVELPRFDPAALVAALDGGERRQLVDTMARVSAWVEDVRGELAAFGAMREED